LKSYHERFVSFKCAASGHYYITAGRWLAYCYARGSFAFMEYDDMIKLVRIPLLYGTLICGMTEKIPVISPSARRLEPAGSM
jgi:hypothetical protein